VKGLVQAHQEAIEAKEKVDQAAEDAARLKSTGSDNPRDYVLTMSLALSPNISANPPQDKLRTFVDCEMQAAAEKESNGEEYHMGLDTEGQNGGKANYVQIAGPYSPSISGP
jgi:hypothetical protein